MLIKLAKNRLITIGEFLGMLMLATDLVQEGLQGCLISSLQAVWLDVDTENNATQRFQLFQHSEFHIRRSIDNLNVEW